ncbi:MAG: hypothetical protein CHACPFDD_01655 [Phycisphaerae bacterium]|nr:hypothetical protein [Phycisphaerae bacterium]
MLHIPGLRFGKAYESLETVEIVHHRTRAPVARVSQLNAGLIARDLRRVAEARGRLRGVPMAQFLSWCAQAAESFLHAELPIGAEGQSPEKYVEQLSATTGMPRTLCRRNMQKIADVLSNMPAVLSGLTRGLDLSVLDDDAGNASLAPAYRAETDCLGAVMPSNSSGVHGLWLPAVALKIPLVLKPGREEPWTPHRIMQAFLAAGSPREAFGFYPTDHAGATEILRLCGRSMLFGDSATTEPYAHDRRVELHGPGYSKVLIGEDWADRWAEFVPLLASSIAENGGRSCLNASAIWTPRHGREIAQAVAAELARIEALPAEDERAALAAFNNPKTAEFFDQAIEHGLQVPGAEEMTARQRRGPRLVRLEGCAYVLPTVVSCASHEHPLANREFLLPYAAVVECAQEEMLARIGPTLVCTALTGDAGWIRQLCEARCIDRLNIGPIPTWKIRWDQPHEGNLFELLYRRRALQQACPT